LTPAATWHFGPEFGREHLIHQLVCGVTCAEERYKMLWIVTPILVEGEQIAVLAANITSQALQLSLLSFPGRAVNFMNARMSGTIGTML